MAGPSPQLRWTQEDVNEFSRVIAEESAKFTKAMIEKAVEPLKAEIAALKARGGEFAGPFEPGKSYSRGSLVQRRGLWLVLNDTTATPGDSPDYRLIIREPR